MSFTMTVTGLGPICMPQLITFLMTIYDAHNTVLIIAGLAAHAFVSSSLLQPVKWHMKEEVVEDGNEEENEKLGNIEEETDVNKNQTVSLLEKGNFVLDN